MPKRTKWSLLKEKEEHYGSHKVLPLTQNKIYSVKELIRRGSLKNIQEPRDEPEGDGRGRRGGGRTSLRTIPSVMSSKSLALRNPFEDLQLKMNNAPTFSKNEIDSLLESLKKSQEEQFTEDEGNFLDSGIRK